VESSGGSGSFLESNHPAEEEQPSLDARIQAQILADEQMEEDLLFDKKIVVTPKLLPA
jgi:hypothetical protein